MKKTTVLFLLFIIFISDLSGCSDKGDNSHNRTMQIPADGIISANVFEKIKDNDDIGIFNGNSNDITYQWLFMGSLIDSAKDENLLVSFSNTQNEEIKKQLSSEYVQELSFSLNDIPNGKPTLSIYFIYPWNVDFVEVYRYDSALNEAVLVSTAALENVPNAVITFIPQEYKGLFYLVGRNNDSQDNPNIQNTQTNEVEPQRNQNPQQDDYVNEGDSQNNNNYTPDTQPQTEQRDNPTVTQDQYLTDPIPDSRPTPVEPEDVVVDDSKRYTATISIRCDTILNNMNKFNKDKLSVLPSDGTIMNTRTAVFYEGESVFDVLQREVRASGIHMEFQFTPIYNSVYIQGINNIYEFDCGELSGWMYKVNGWFPNYGASRYSLQQGDIIEWVYTCDLGSDVGGFYAVGELP